MNNPFVDYLALLEQLRGELERLTACANDKIRAARNSDLEAMDQIMKQEQAATLTLRGFEQKKAAMLTAMGLTSVPITALADNYPPKLRTEARQTVERLRAQHQLYTAASSAARSVLERDLREFSKILDAASAAPVQGAGYEADASEPPAPMKTDLRA